MSQSLVKIHVNDEHGSRKLAHFLGERLARCDVLLLNGRLAAGKTFFVRAILESMGSNEHVTSPTYTLVNTYAAPTCDILHIDAYRLENMAEFHDLGLDIYEENSIYLIEWGARLREAFETVLNIDIELPAHSHHDDARVYQISSEGERWQPVIDALKKEFL